MVIFQEEKRRYGQWLINRPDRFLCNQTKEIKRDFTKIAVTLEPKVQFTQNKNHVKASVIFVNSNQTLMPVCQKKIVKIDALLLTHAVLVHCCPSKVLD